MAGAVLVVALAAAALLAVAAGCGGSANHAGEYPAGARLDFLSRCTAQAGSSAEGCSCLYDELSKRIPYGHFVTVGPVIAAGGNVSGSDASALQDAANTCAAKIEKSHGG